MFGVGLAEFNQLFVEQACSSRLLALATSVGNVTHSNNIEALTEQLVPSIQPWQWHCGKIT
jgi:hypothetical protein